MALTGAFDEAALAVVAEALAVVVSSGAASVAAAVDSSAGAAVVASDDSVVPSDDDPPAASASELDSPSPFTPDDDEADPDTAILFPVAFWTDAPDPAAAPLPAVTLTCSAQLTAEIPTRTIKRKSFMVSCDFSQ